MTAPQFQTWQSVQEEVLRRIHAREWKPGDLIPNEADLSREFGCARTTVNRALRALAESGLLERRRKAGTRVALQPVAKATLHIAALRNEVEERNQKYDYRLIERALAVPPPAISTCMKTPFTTELLHIHALHLADRQPYALENRWINVTAVPAALDEPFKDISSNEWLLENVPFTNGDISFFALSASDLVARHLACQTGDALLSFDRVTWDGANMITKVCITYRPDHHLRTSL